MPIIIITVFVVITTLIFALLLRKRRKVFFIPFGVFVLISVYVLITLNTVEESTRVNDGFASGDHYQGEPSPKQSVEIEQVSTLTGNLMFREYKGKINLGALTPTSTRRDSISILYDYINLESDIKQGSSKWNIVYMDSVAVQAVSSFTLEDLREDSMVVELVLEAERLSDNEWFCLELLGVELKKGMTSFLNN
jgi:hypothetical protein